jgi:hypothetical protein
MMNDITAIIQKDLDKAESDCGYLTTDILKMESDLTKLKKSHLFAQDRVQGLKDLLVIWETQQASGGVNQ